MSDWDDHAVDWDEQAAVRAYADNAFRSLTALADEQGIVLDGLVACDFGCGTGLLTELLVSRCSRIDAVDTSPAMRHVLAGKVDRERWGQVRVLDRLPAESQGYGLIVCSSVLSFVDDYSGTVRDLFGHLAPGGLLVQWDWEAEPGDAEAGGLSRDGILETLAGVGLEHVDVRVGFELAVDDHVMAPLMGSGRRRR